MADAEAELFDVEDGWVERFDRDNEWMAGLDWSRHRHRASDYVSDRLLLSGVAKIFADHLCAPSYPEMTDFLAQAGNTPAGGMVGAEEAFGPDGAPIHSIHARLASTARRHADEHGVGIASADVVTRDEWEAIVEHAAPYWGWGVGARRAVARLAPIIAGLAAREEIACFARPVGGGARDAAIRISGPDWWDIDPDMAVRRFAACGLNLKSPFDAGAPIDHLVFVARNGLQNVAIDTARKHYVPTAALEYGDHILKRRVDHYAVQTEEVAAFLIALMDSGECENWTNLTFQCAVQDEFGKRGLGRCYERAKAMAIEDEKRSRFGRRRSG